MFSLRIKGFFLCCPLEENTKRLNEISTNPDAIEQIAREKYLMKKPNEDIYVFED